MSPHRATLPRPFPALAGAILMLVASVSAPTRAATAADGIWQDLNAGGSVPYARLAHSAGYDPVTSSMIIFGGDPTIQETHRLSFTTDPSAWSPVTGAMPSGRKGSTMVFDSGHHRMLMFGGYDVNWRNDVWALSLDGAPVWTQLVTSGTPPPIRLYQVTVYDAVHDRMLVMGGLDGSPFNDVWSLSLSGTPTWTHIVPGGTLPAARWGHVGIYDAARDHLVIWGADSDPAVWVLALSPVPTWTRYNIASVLPYLIYATAVYDASNDRMLVFGGSTSSQSPQPTNATYALDLRTMTWSVMNTAGAPPSGRFLHTSVYDPVGVRMIVFGGYGGDSHTYALQLTAPTGPQIFSFIPHGGEVGDPVAINGSGLAGTTAVKFNGIDAPVLTATNLKVTTQVPAGATTGPISITANAQTVTTDSLFYVGVLPSVTSVEPDSGHFGDHVLIHGAHFTNVIEVGLGTLSGPFTVHSDTEIEAVVDSQSATGMVHVRTQVGSNPIGPTFHMLSPDKLPHIVSIRDVRRDQGGQVVIKWRRSEFDGPYGTVVSSYRVWRRAPADAALHGTGTTRLERRVAPDRIATEYWEPIATLPASQIPGYAYTAATLRDSMADDNPYTAFLVQAVVSNTLSYWSGADSAYSVDDLAPPQPAQFAGVYGGTAVALHWTPNDAPDLFGYRLYSGGSPAFVPGAGNLVTATTDTGYVDSNFDPGRLYYKLSAVDVHGNESRYVLVSPNGATSTFASFVNAETAPDRVTVTWAAVASPSLRATVERRAPNGGWLPVAEIVTDGSGYLRYEDHDILPGQRYGYRLLIVDDDRTVTLAETWVDVPGFELAFASIRPNPSTGGPVRLAFTQAPGASVRVEVVDIAGRIVARHTVDAGASGRGELALETGSWPAGVYLARLAQAGRTSTRRFVVTR